MFRKSIEAVIAQGTSNLEALGKSAADKAVEARVEVSRCQSEIQTLVNMAKQVPEKVFDRYSQVLVSTLQIGSSPSLYGEIRIADGYGQLRGLMGDDLPKPGKYRVIVLLEPIS